MTALVTLLIVLLLSLVVTRVATVALTLTGLSRESARFQARSAFTGAGFTTSESELVVKHPVRRRIVMMLMLLGNAGVVAAVGSLLLTFIEPAGAEADWALRLLLLGGGIGVLWLLATSHYVDRLVSYVTTRALRRWTSIDVTDYAELLHLGGEHKVVVMPVEEGHWAADKSLEEMDLRSEGMLTLGVERRDGTFLGVPPLDTRVHVGDQLTIYGRSAALDALGHRHAGAGARAEHRRLEDVEEARIAGQKRDDPERASE